MDQGLRVDFTRGRMAGVRASVREYAAGHGLAGCPLEDLVLAAGELTTNAVLHGGGRGTLRMWTAGGRLWCEVRDDGPGVARPVPADAPDPAEAGGRGLWLTRALFPDLAITGPGAVVTFSAPLAKR
ncbi:ATP-binding protein [Nonomuraea longicatena]